MIPIVIDTNVFFSGLYNQDGLERKILDITLENHTIRLFAPDIFWEEISMVFEEKLGYKKSEVIRLIKIFEIIKVNFDQYKEKFEEARNHITHESDVHFVAVGLYLNVPIWSGNIQHFKP
ncbi:MAG: PIN domain-containing protein, partial [Candidatus Lokiarchaeota archaeon]